MAAVIYKSSSFPQAPGARLEVLCNVAGPASYTAVTPGTPPTGGQLVSAKDMGLTEISDGFAAASDDGTYTATIIVNSQLVPLSAPRGSTSFILQWRVSATGAEVAGATNLSARSMRLFIRGTY